jgi:hypothetical protein
MSPRIKIYRATAYMRPSLNKPSRWTKTLTSRANQERANASPRRCLSQKQQWQNHASRRNSGTRSTISCSFGSNARRMASRHLLSHPCSEADGRSPQRGTAQQSSSPVSSAPASTDIKGVRSNCKPVSSPVGAKRCSTISLLYVRNLWAVKEVPRFEGAVADIFDDVPRDKPFRFNPPDARSSPDYIRPTKRQVCLCSRQGPSDRSFHLGSR